MADLTLAQADRIAEAALRRARELGAAPLTVAILDRGGHLVELRREDRSTFLRPDIAIAKAWGALGLGAPSAGIARIAAERPLLFQALSDLSGGRVIPVPGGVLVRDPSGELIGAVGVSGDASETDEACAVHGIEAAGLTGVGGPPAAR